MYRNSSTPENVRNASRCSVKPAIRIVSPNKKTSSDKFVRLICSCRRMASRLTPNQIAYRDLWTGLLQRFNEEKPGVTRRSRSLTRSWLKVPIGLANAHLEWVVHKLNRPDGWFEVGLHLEHSDGGRNQAALERLQPKQQQMEAIIGEPLHLEPWGRRRARAYARIDSPKLDEDVQDWALRTMLRFLDVVEQLDVVAELRQLGW